MVKKGIVILFSLLVVFSFVFSFVCVNAASSAGGVSVGQSLREWWNEEVVGDTSPQVVDEISQKIIKPSFFEKFSRFFIPVLSSLLIIFLVVSIIYWNKSKWWKWIFFSILGILVLYGAVSGWGEVSGVLKGLGIEVPSTATSDITIGQLFAKTSNDGPTLFMTLANAGKYDMIFKIVGSNIMKPISYTFSHTIGPALGFVSFWEFVGYFLQMFLIGWLAAFMAIFCIGKAKDAGIFDDRGLVMKFTRVEYVKVFVGFTYAILFSIPILKPVLRFLTLEFLVSFLPFPLNIVIKALLFSLLTIAVFIIPGLVKYYKDSKDKKKKLDALDNVALGAGAMSTVGGVVRGR